MPIYSANVPLLSADWSPYGGQIAIGAPVSSEMTRSMSSQDAAVANVPVQIITPDPSIERLQSIARTCETALSTNSVAVEQALDAPLEALNTQADTTPTIDLQAVEAFITQVEALPDDMLPPGCEADLLAVAEALRAD
ncbi:MAG: hypothetical protein HC828_06660 [Blastochloris sp.]|nr:hypothetical protein [Blastochloris sp.]